MMRYLFNEIKIISQKIYLIRKNNIFNIFFLISISCFLLLITGCTEAVQERIQKIELIAQNHGVNRCVFDALGFKIATYSRNQCQDLKENIHNKEDFVFYIEGDGLVLDGEFISSNPTPTSNLILELSIKDPRKNVVYLARPCQFLYEDEFSGCNPEYWTDRRMSQEIVDSINIAINKIALGDIDLIGYSGGGGIAVLVAAINPKVKSVITLAGNLDIEYFANYHCTLPISESLNPIKYAKNISHIPQLHLIGSKDSIIPLEAVKNFVKASGEFSSYQILDNIYHNSDWRVFSNLIFQRIQKPNNSDSN